MLYLWYLEVFEFIFWYTQVPEPRLIKPLNNRVYQYLIKQIVIAIYIILFKKVALYVLALFIYFAYLN
jgi:hypothetical protein